MRAKKISVNKPNKFDLRLTDDQLSFVKYESERLNISSSQYIRMLIDFKRIERRGIGYENF